MTLSASPELARPSIFHARVGSQNSCLYLVVADGGNCSNFGIEGSIWSHGWASEKKISLCRFNRLGSSRVLANTPTKGESPFVNSPPVMRDPHSGQKPRLCFSRLILGRKW